MHTWGDGFDFDKLEEAGQQISKVFEILDGRRLCYKEKYGTLRYELLYDTDNPDNSEIPTLENEDLNFAILLAIVDYPELAAEIADDCLFANKWEQVEKVRRNRIKETKDE